MEQQGYEELVGAYADGVRALFAAAGQKTGDRGGRGPASYTGLAELAEQLTPDAERLAESLRAGLADADASARGQAEERLLAQVMSDLQVGEYLWQAAEDETTESPWGGRDRSGDRAIRSGGVEPYLRMLAGGEAKALEAGREATPPLSVDEARPALTELAEDTMALVLMRAVDTAKGALKGLFGLGAGELAKAAGVVSLEVAQALGQTEQVTGLYSACRGFLARTYQSIVALLGPSLAKMAGEQVLAWVAKIKDGEPVGKLLEGMYETKKTQKKLKAEIEGSGAELSQFVSAIEQVGGLNEAFQRKTSLVGKIVPALGWATLLPATVLPQARLVVAAAYIALCGYVVWVGADYVDAPRMQRLGRVPGVRHTVEVNLAPQTGG